jgi:hypothetical protein
MHAVELLRSRRLLTLETVLGDLWISEQAMSKLRGARSDEKFYISWTQGTFIYFSLRYCEHMLTRNKDNMLSPRALIVHHPASHIAFSPPPPPLLYISSANCGHPFYSEYTSIRTSTFVVFPGALVFLASSKTDGYGHDARERIKCEGKVCELYHSLLSLVFGRRPGHISSPATRPKESGDRYEIS